jgi:2'-5' RNA ligase
LSAEQKQYVRAFVSIHLPAAIREKLQGTQQDMAKSLPDGSVRWAPFEQLHLTLEFLGNVDPAKLRQINFELAVTGETFWPFTLAVDSVGAFSSIRNPRVIWAGIKGDLEALLGLQGNVRGTVAPYVTEQETRAYRPHVTLGRVRPIDRRDLRKVSDALGSVTDRSFGSWRVEEFALMQSQLSPRGSQHSTLATFRLGG